MNAQASRFKYGLKHSQIMKKTLFIIITLLTLAACGPQLPEGNLNFDQVISDFDIFDQIHQSSWRYENIPSGTIQPSALEPWILHVKELANRTADEDAKHLVEARTQMLKTQAALYDMERLDGEIPMVPIGDEGKAEMFFVSKKLDCSKVLVFAKYYGLKHEAAQALIRYSQAIEKISPENKMKLETIAFHQSKLPGAPEQIKAAVTAIKEQCDVEIVIS
jgi:hypothetical protein